MPFPVMAESLILGKVQLERTTMLSHSGLIIEPLATDFLTELVPAGTAMVIPSRILEEYQSHQFYGQPFNYLIDRYIVIGPSDLQKGESTYYIPLSLKDDNSESKEKITMVDVNNIKKNPEDEKVFFIRHDTKGVFFQARTEPHTYTILSQ